MNYKRARAVVLTAALLITCGAPTVPTHARNVGQVELLPEKVRLSGIALTNMSAHGMMSSQKRNFVRTHKLTSRKTGEHGFAGGKPNGKG
jgi:hypothetical protein